MTTGPPPPHRRQAASNPGRRRDVAPHRGLTLFSESGGGRFYLRPGTLNGFRRAQAARHPSAGDPPCRPDPEYLAALRQKLDRRRLRSNGVDGESCVTDDALAAAVIGGVVSNPAFLDIVDELLVRADCLCCYYTRRRHRAEQAEEQILSLLAYYSQDDYEGSNAFYRQLGCYVRDFTPCEVGLVARHTRQGPAERVGANGGDSDGSGVRSIVQALARAPGLCAIHAAHPPPADSGKPLGILGSAGISFWLCSTPEARRFMRRASRAAKAAGLSLTSRLATGRECFYLRYKARYYALEALGPGDVGAVWGVLAAAARRPPAARPLSAPTEKHGDSGAGEP